MLSAKLKFRNLLSSDWFIGFFLLAIFLLTNGYLYGWDDQHLEIPLLKSLIDPDLYPHDYYVQGLKQNFISFFYAALAKLITLDQIPAVYFFLYLISRYFLFFWMYKLWHLIAKDKFAAIVCAAAAILLTRVEEFLYRTFSHQEFALAIIMAGIYFFYKERFLLAALLLGLATNIHAVYSLFPMIYLNAFLLIFWKQKKWETVVKTNLVYLLAALPIILLIGQKYLLAAPLAPAPAEWMPLYQLASPQNFIFQNIPLSEVFGSLKTFFLATRKFLFLILLYTVNLLFYRPFATDHKIYAMSVSTVTMLAVSFVFTYIFPERLIIDLNLIRNIQYLQFFYVGYTTLLFVERIQKGKVVAGFFFGILFMSLRGLSLDHYTRTYLYLAMMIAGLLLLNLIWAWVDKRPYRSLIQKRLFLIIPLLVATCSYSFFHYRYLKIVQRGPGFWQMQRNWEDIQHYVRKHTPPSALFLVPHDMEMGGFRIHSERSIVLCYRDCGIIGFDYRAAVEWHKRLKEIESFKVYVNEPFEQALKIAITQYRVNYVVFMRFTQPQQDSPLFKKIYENDVFALYRVLLNPIKEN